MAPIFTGLKLGGFGKNPDVTAGVVRDLLPTVTDRWGFESNSLVSTGTSGSTITNSGATFSATAKTGTVALSFDGSNDYAVFNGGSTTTNISIAFWIYWRGHNGAGRSYLVDFGHP